MIALMDRATLILETMRILQAPACYGEDHAAARIVDAVLRWSVA